MWALLLGFFSPIVVATVNRPYWSPASKVIVMIATSIAIGLGSAFFAGSFAGKDIVTGMLTAAVASIAAFHGVFRPTGIAPAVEIKTSPALPTSDSKEG